MTEKQITAPSTEPVSLADLKAHLRVEDDTDNALITALGKAAREYAERYTGRQLITAEWRVQFDAFPEGDNPINLPHPPLLNTISGGGSGSGTSTDSGVTITYVDTSGASQTLASSRYVVDDESFLGRIYLAYGQTWPTVRDQRNAITVTYSAGYGAAATDIPETICAAIKLLVGHWYENREPVGMDNAVPVLLDMFRVVEAR